jgi:hypothetical protein
MERVKVSLTPGAPLGMVSVTDPVPVMLFVCESVKPSVPLTETVTGVLCPPLMVPIAVDWPLLEGVEVGGVWKLMTLTLAADDGPDEDEEFSADDGVWPFTMAKKSWKRTFSSWKNWPKLNPPHWG